jgi:hypothetical protein
VEKNLDNIFHINEVDTEELISVLMNHFHHGSYPANNIFRLQKEEFPYFVELVFNKQGSKIMKVKISSDFPDQELVEVEKKIDDTLIKNQEPSYEQIIAYCSNKVDGYFRYKNLFQIQPISESSPQLPWAYGDHPFILQVSYLKSPEFTINNQRKTASSNKYIRLLNLFTAGKIYTQHKYTRNEWVMITDKPENWTSQWMQLGYIAKDLSQLTDSFTEITGLKEISKIPMQQFYDQRGISVSDSLVLPENIEKSLDIAFGLKEDKWIKFFIATTWYSKSNNLWNESHSASFLALVTALECLTDKPKSCPECGNSPTEAIESCGKCGEKKYSLTKHFKAFLDKHVPFINQPDWQQEKKLIYKIRSDLTHGIDLLEHDLETAFHIFSARGQSQDSLHRNLHFITTIALINWLHSQEQGNVETSDRPIQDK